jgi:NADPH2:quinone reductase
MTKRRVVRMGAYGDPDVLDVLLEDLPDPGPGEVRIRHHAIGFNFIDVNQRRGFGALPLPSGLGFEGVGTVEAVAADVGTVRVGERVAVMNAGVGAYASHRNVAADTLIRVPDDLDDDAVAATLFKGLTAQYLLHRTVAVGPSHAVLVHAAAGGVGSILARWAKHLGATVMGTVGGEAKIAAARAAGCDVVVDYNRAGWAERLLGETRGRKADVVYDSVGRHTFMDSLDCAAPFGTVVVFGAASGPAPAIAPELLNTKGCLFLTRPSVFPHNARPEVRAANAEALFRAMRDGSVHVPIGARFALDRIRDVHRAAEARAVTGAITIHP